MTLRANNGLPAVTLDPALTRLAEAQAVVMARRDRLDHNAGKPFLARLKASGYECNVLLDDVQARLLARFLNVDAYTTGTLAHNGAGLVARVRVVDIGGSGHAFLFTVSSATGLAFSRSWTLASIPDAMVMG